MKFVSQILKILGILILLIVVIFIPVSILTGDFVNLVLKPGELVGIVDAELLDSSVFAEIAEKTISYYERDQQMQQLSASERVIVTALDELSDRKLENLFELLLPPKLLEDSIEDINDGFFDWLYSSSDSIDYEFDTIIWKNNLSENIGPAIDLVFDELPICTEQEFIDMNNLIKENSNKGIEPCKPPEVLYSEVKINLIDQVSDISALVKDEIQADNLFEGNEAEARLIKAWMLSARTISRYGLIVILFFYFVGVGLGTRSASTFFNQAGWPLAISSLPLVVVGFVIKFVPYEAIFQLFLRSRSNTPVFIYKPVAFVMDDLLSTLGSGYLVKGFIILAVGLISLTTGFVIKKILDNNENK